MTLDEILEEALEECKVLRTKRVDIWQDVRSDILASVLLVKAFRVHRLFSLNPSVTWKATIVHEQQTADYIADQLKDIINYVGFLLAKMQWRRE